MTVDINMTSGKGILLLVAAVNLVLGLACDSPSAPRQEQQFTSYRISGVVTDDGGTPIAGAGVFVDHGPNLPDLNDATQQARSITGLDGRYDIFLSSPHVGYVPFAMIRVSKPSNRIPGEYSAHTELLDAQSTSVVKNIRLRRTRIINPGQSIPIAIESDSSLCNMGGISVTTLCEWFFVTYVTPGTLTVEARPEAGSVVPTLRDEGNRQGQGTLTVPAADSDFFVDVAPFAIAVPIGTAPQRYEVTTSLRP